MTKPTDDMPSDRAVIETERQHAIDEIQVLIDEGFASGPAQPFDMQTFLAEREAR